MKRTPIRRISEKRASTVQGRVYSTLRQVNPERKATVPEKYQNSSSRKPLPKVNPEQQVKRRKLTRAFHQTPEFVAAGNEAMQRAQGRCEFRTKVLHPGSSGGAPVRTHRATIRCSATDGLERHCKSYPKTRPIAAKDIAIYCTEHHQYVEMTQFGYRHSRRKVA